MRRLRNCTVALLLGYCGAPRGRLTTRCHGYIIGDNSDEGKDASLRVEMGNVGFNILTLAD